MLELIARSASAVQRLPPDAPRVSQLLGISPAQRLLHLRPEFRDQRRGGERPRERRTLACPLGPVAELPRGPRGGVQRLPGVISAIG